MSVTSMSFSSMQKKITSMPTHLERGLAANNSKPSTTNTPFLTVPEARSVPPTPRAAEGRGRGGRPLSADDSILTGMDSQCICAQTFIYDG